MISYTLNSYVTAGAAASKVGHNYSNTCGLTLT